MWSEISAIDTQNLRVNRSGAYVTRIYEHIYNHIIKLGHM